MTTWATTTTSMAIRHPWFSQPTMKRKLADSPSPISSSSSSLRSPSPSGSPPPPKRRKFSALESGFADLTLDNDSYLATPSSPTVSDVPDNPYAPGIIASSIPCNDHPCDVVLPSSIEEPSIPEVRMKYPSWYEPEPDRIVVTNIDSSSDEEDENTDPGVTTISIPRALLKRFTLRPGELTDTQLPSSNSNQALILFQPLPVIGTKVINKSEENQSKENPQVQNRTREIIWEEDAMDIGP